MFSSICRAIFNNHGQPLLVSALLGMQHSPNLLQQACDKDVIDIHQWGDHLYAVAGRNFPDMEQVGNWRGMFCSSSSSTGDMAFLKMFHKLRFQVNHRVAEMVPNRIMQPIERRAFLHKRQRQLDTVSEFHVPMSYDHRGRAYCVDSPFNFQGDARDKALIHWAVSKPLDEEGHANLELAKSLAEDEFTHASLDSPETCRVSVDATASGLQMMSLLTHDGRTGMHCNLTGNQRNDAYGALRMEGYGRKELKAAVMTVMYGSQAIPREVFGDRVDEFYAICARTFPGPWELNQRLQAAWNSTTLYDSWTLPDGFDVVVPHEVHTTAEVPLFGKTIEYSYYRIAPYEGGRSLSANLIHSVDALVMREVCKMALFPVSRRNIPDPNGRGESPQLEKLLERGRASGFYSVNCLLHLKPETVWMLEPQDREAIEEMLLVMRDVWFPVAPVHDNFTVHPNDVGKVQHLYRYVLAKIARSSLGHYLCNQLRVTCPNHANLTFDQVLASRHALSME